MMITGMRIVKLVLLLLLCVHGEVYAHAPKENYIWINIDTDRVVGRFELNVNDIRTKLHLDVDAAGGDRLSGVKQVATNVQDYLVKNFSIADTKGEIEIIFTESGVSADAPEFAQFFFHSNRLPDSEILEIRNTVFLTPDMTSDDPLHRSLIVLEYNKAAGKDFGADTPVLVFSPKKVAAELNIVNPSKILEWQDFLKQGVLHIWMGLDHVLFVMVLLLSTVLMSKDGAWQPIPAFGRAFLNTLKIITLFTIAHSITLTLAVFNLVDLNSVLVETIIAVSIIAVALNNIYPKYNSHAWLLVFVFGLFHGLGFASVMADLQFRTGLLGHILVMFNVGVEIGQFAIVAVLFPLMFYSRKSGIYRPAVVIPISLLAIVLATHWVLQRTGLYEYVT